MSTINRLTVKDELIIESTATQTGVNATAIGGPPLDPTVITDDQSDVTGEQLVKNWRFKDWTGTPLNDTPDDWTVSESVPNAYVTQVGDACRMFSDGTAVNISQGSLQSGKEHMLTIEILEAVTGSITLDVTGGGGTIAVLSEVGFYSFKFTPSTSGGLNIKRTSACDITFANVQIREISTAPTTDSIEEAITRQNDIDYPNDIAQAGNVACVNGGEQDVIATAVDTEHYRTKIITGDGSAVHTVSAKFRDGDKSIVRYTNDTTSEEAYFDLSSGSFGTVTSGLKTASLTENGWTKVIVSEVMNSGSNTVGFGAAEADNDITYLGDGATIDLFIKEFHSYDDTIESNIGFYDNGAATYPRTLKWELTVDQTAKNNAGLIQRADALNQFDGWEFPTEGYSYKETPGNLAVLERVGFWKRADDGTWEIPKISTPTTQNRYNAREDQDQINMDTSGDIIDGPVLIMWFNNLLNNQTLGTCRYLVSQNTVAVYSTFRFNNMALGTAISGVMKLDNNSAGTIANITASVNGAGAGLVRGWIKFIE
jgi:hypothetical protein